MYSHQYVQALPPPTDYDGWTDSVSWKGWDNWTSLYRTRLLPHNNNIITWPWPCLAGRCAVSDELTEQGEPLACLVNGLLYPHQNTCTHMTTSPQHFCGVNACSPFWGCTVKEAQVYIMCTHTTQAPSATHTHSSIVLASSLGSRWKRSGSLRTRLV